MVAGNYACGMVLATVLGGTETTWLTVGVTLVLEVATNVYKIMHLANKLPKWAKETRKPLTERQKFIGSAVMLSAEYSEAMCPLVYIASFVLLYYGANSYQFAGLKGTHYGLVYAPAEPWDAMKGVGSLLVVESGVMLAVMHVAKQQNLRMKNMLAYMLDQNWLGFVALQVIAQNIAWCAPHLMCGNDASFEFEWKPLG